MSDVMIRTPLGPKRMSLIVAALQAFEAPKPVSESVQELLDGHSVTRYIIVFGNPVEGFTFKGPFLDYEEAEDYVDCDAHDWWIAEMEGPL